MGVLLGVLFHFIGGFASTPTGTLFWTYVMGLLWGVGGLTFGLSMRYLGISLGMSVVLGIATILASGALVGYGNSWSMQ